MKIIHFGFIILLSLLPFLSTAQIQLGVKAGISGVDAYERFDGTENISLSGMGVARIGSQIGLFSNLPLNNRLSIRTEILLADKGIRFENILPSPPENSSSLKLLYLNLPLLLDVKANNRLSFQIGPEAGYLLTAWSTLQEDFTSLKELFQTWDLGVSTGVQVKLSKRVSADLRYTHGFLGFTQLILTDQNGEKIGELSQMNQTLQLSLSYLVLE
ncbi:MAG: PorT family protein [Bacteroidia bacterium]|nr:PorT family protein [Bacteroidia bacterium]